jgi:hypothetical protein
MQEIGWTTAVADDLRTTESPVRLLLETVHEQLGCGRGHWTVESISVDGRIVKAYVHHDPIPARELDPLAGRASEVPDPDSAPQPPSAA